MHFCVLRGAWGAQTCVIYYRYAAWRHPLKHKKLVKTTDQTYVIYYRYAAWGTPLRHKIELNSCSNICNFTTEKHQRKYV